MSKGTVRDDGRYWAFISYSHKDAAFGRRLHRRLEAYALPRRLVGMQTAQGAVPRRLAPIFRDRDEFPAAKDLSAEVQAALKVSRSLIVVCSPTAAVSPWVAREIELFHALHPERPILAAIRQGEPHDCFPEALRRAGPDGSHVEPLAADFRRNHDGWELGQLKLVAGMLGVGLDELVQRNSQRFARRVTAVTAAALALVLVMAVLTVFALNARSEAERQRAEAEGLVEFMLTDLRTTLKGVGRLDAMTAVNEHALKYYGDQDLDRLPVESLERRVRILHAIGEDEETRGDHEAAVKPFAEALRSTAALLAESPNDPERIYNHAQSEYWIGYHAYSLGRYDAAKPAWLSYKRLADRMVAIAPGNPRFLRELAFSEGNLCTLEINAPDRAAAAVKLCSSALAHMEAAARGLGNSRIVEADLANRHSWLASAYLELGDRGRAKVQLLAQEKILNHLLSADPQNLKRKSAWVISQRVLAQIEVHEGFEALALKRLRGALAELNRMIAFDSQNKDWVEKRTGLESDISKIISPHRKAAANRRAPADIISKH